MNDTKGLVEEILVCLGNERAYREIIGAKKEDNPDWIDLLERALTALKAQGWQPISTAPRDERLIVLRIGNERPFVGYHVFDEDETGKRSAWMDADESFLEYKPTHWMPLPQPPREPNNKEEA